jgi:hypothetical protein
MPTYSDLQLAQAAQRILRTIYDNPTSIKIAFATRIRGIAQSLSPRQLIASELDLAANSIAKSVFDKLNHIGIDKIDFVMSAAIKEAARQPSFDIDAHESDFRKLARTLVGKLITEMNQLQAKGRAEDKKRAKAIANPPKQVKKKAVTKRKKK